MGHGTAEGFCRNIFSGNSLDDLRTGDEHLAGLIHHEDKVGNSRRINSAAGTGSHNYGNLRDNAGCDGVIVEYFTESGQGIDPFLDPGTAGVVEANDRSTHLHGHILNLHDFFSVILAQGTSQNSEVLCKSKDQPAVYGTVSGNNAVARGFFICHVKVGGPMGYEYIQLHKTAFVKQNIHSLSGSQLAAGMLGIDSLLSASQCNLRFQLTKFF